MKYIRINVKFLMSYLIAAMLVGTGALAQNTPPTPPTPIGLEASQIGCAQSDISNGKSGPTKCETSIAIGWSSGVATTSYADTAGNYQLWLSNGTILFPLAGCSTDINCARFWFLSAASAATTNSTVFYYSPDGSSITAIALKR